jgi:hypothetical protein
MQHSVTEPVCGLAIDPECAVAVAMDGPLVFCSAPCEVTWRGSTAGNLF